MTQITIISALMIIHRGLQVAPGKIVFFAAEAGEPMRTTAG
jgi:hypothetical protein